MPFLGSRNPRAERWIARALRGTNPPGPVGAAELAYIRGEVEDLPGDSPGEAAYDAAWNAMGPRTRDLAIANRPDAVDAYAEAAAEAARGR